MESQRRVCKKIRREQVSDSAHEVRPTIVRSTKLRLHSPVLSASMPRGASPPNTPSRRSPLSQALSVRMCSVSRLSAMINTGWNDDLRNCEIGPRGRAKVSTKKSLENKQGVIGCQLEVGGWEGEDGRSSRDCLVLSDVLEEGERVAEEGKCTGDCRDANEVARSEEVAKIDEERRQSQEDGEKGQGGGHGRERAGERRWDRWKSRCGLWSS